MILPVRSLLSPGRYTRALLTSAVGIGSLPLAPEETQAERELLKSLPEFQEAAQVLLGQGGDEARLLPNCKRAEKALPMLQRTVEICR
ncbi:hypothetical protein PF010_g27938 [Phytophthora fragariae]|uniref:Uncharacterized protein n=1 Tax=Phytophthora fragariae TaxID=53985 RepID=A0A6G0JSF0_9STRA|nr:hypothetical protein PF010_g27938 [Phytophthora fragariae]